MGSAIIDLSMSSMSVFMDKRDPAGSHFRWKSIQKFLYIASTYSYGLHNFDIFSKVCNDIRIFDFLLMEIIIGMAYMFMDFFIKQYTRRLDSAKLLNPLLRGISFGQFLQTALWSLTHAGYVADSIRFLFISFQSMPSWTHCVQNNTSNLRCWSSSEIINNCNADDLNQTIIFSETSAHFNYEKSFKYHDRSILTTRFFVIGIVWMFNFFFATVTDETLIKIFKVAFIFRTVTSFVTTIFLTCSASRSNMRAAFVDILKANANHSYDKSMEHITYIYGIGFLGLYDFGSISPYMMVDNAVVIFTIIYTIIAFIRSWLVRISYLELIKCVKVEKYITPHYLLFAVLPLSTEFFEAHKVYLLHIYMNLLISMSAYLTMMTLTMSKLLHSEISSVKNIYIVGLLCCVGFGLSVPIALSTTGQKENGLLIGLNVSVLYLGGFKVAAIMWLYGVQRFSTDIHFWLGFKPTKFWTIIWMLLPIILVYFLARRIYYLTQLEYSTQSLTAIIWIVFTLIIVGFFQIKSIARYILRNNIAGVFRPSIRYGPLDFDDRKRRKTFNETIQLRQCKHNCNALDSLFECNHLPLRQRTKSASIVGTESLTSLTNIYDARKKDLRRSTALDTELHY